MKKRFIHLQPPPPPVIDEAAAAFDTEKMITLINCDDFYVRMFNRSGEKKFVRVSSLPRKKKQVQIKIPHEEFILFDKNGAEKCVIIFPWLRYLSNKYFEETNKGNEFDVLWVANLHCQITYLKSSKSIWIYTLGFALVYLSILIYLIS